MTDKDSDSSEQGMIVSIVHDVCKPEIIEEAQEIDRILTEINPKFSFVASKLVDGHYNEYDF